MKITIESTAKIVTIGVNGNDVPARIWQGTNEDGIPVVCYVTRIFPEIPVTDPNHSELTVAFDRELKRTATPRPAIEAIPLRMIL